MKAIFWKGYCNDERSAAITAIQGTVSKYGDVVDSRLFSDISLALTLEIEEERINDLHAALQRLMRLDGHEPFTSPFGKERTIFLNITFATGSGNLKIETPSVPG